MAFTLTWGTGFEMGALPLTYITSGISLSGTHRTGSYSLYDSRNGASYCYVDLVDGADEIYLAVAHLPGILLSTNEGMRVQLRLTTGEWIEYRAKSNGLFTYIVNGSNKGNGVNTITQGAWYHHQFHVLCSDTGVVEAKVDGKTDFYWEGDTQPGVAATFDRLQFYFANPATWGRWYLDDIAIGTGGWPGDLHFEGLAPTADTESGWTGSDGNQVDNYALVDEKPPSDADYIVADTDGLTDKYSHGGWDGSNKFPVGAVVWARCLRQGSNLHQVKLILDDGTEDISGALDIGTAYGHVCHPVNGPPSGGDWSEAVIDGLEMGVEAAIV